MPSQDCPICGENHFSANRLGRHILNKHQELLMKSSSLDPYPRSKVHREPDPLQQLIDKVCLLDENVKATLLRVDDLELRQKKATRNTCMCSSTISTEKLLGRIDNMVADLSLRVDRCYLEVSSSAKAIRANTNQIVEAPENYGEYNLHQSWHLYS